LCDLDASDLAHTATPFCARTEDGTRFDLVLRSFISSGGCVDADSGATCQATANRVSYRRTQASGPVAGALCAVNLCRFGTCDAVGPCHSDGHVPLGAGCSDGNPCNGEETCDDSGACLPGATPSFDDGNPCTVDSCDPTGGITHTLAAAGASC